MPASGLKSNELADDSLDRLPSTVLPSTSLPSTSLGINRVNGIDGINGLNGTNGGVYVLVLRRRGSAFRMQVGALGLLSFRPGFYCYVGSARRGLAARLRRHLRRAGKRKHWHVDYLRTRTRPVAVLAWAGEGDDECALSRAVGRLAEQSVPGFGSSDCRCKSHLHFFPADPTRRLRALRPRGMGLPRVVLRREP